MSKIEEMSQLNVERKPMPEADASKEGASIRTHEEETSVLGSADWFKSDLQDALHDCASPEEAKQKMKNILESYDEGFGEKSSGFTKPAQNIEIGGMQNMGEYVTAVSAALAQSLGEKYTLEELEQLQYEDILARDSHIGVNRAVYFSFEPGGEQICINMHNAKSLPVEELRKGFNDGLKEIARQLKENPDLAPVTRVAIRSWIVEKHPKVAERYGFSLDGVDSASMSRDDYIRRYGA
jgi:hypothetical protein